MSRSMNAPSHYTITVWAGGDMYTQMRVPATVKDDPQAEYEHILHQLLPRMEDDFGKGVELKQRREREYDISVDKVLVD